MSMQSGSWQKGLTLAVLAVWATQAGAQGKWAARVNGEGIPVGDLEAVLAQRPSPVPLTKELESQVRKAALDMLIHDALMRQFLKRSVGASNPADACTEMENLKTALQKQGKSIEQFLREGKMTEEQLRADINARLQWKNYLTARFSDADIKSY